VACVSRVYTDVATFQLGADGVLVLETFGMTLAELRSRLDVSIG